MKRKGMLVVLLENVNSILFEALRVVMTELLKKTKQNKTKNKEKRGGDDECDEL